MRRRRPRRKLRGKSRTKSTSSSRGSRDNGKSSPGGRDWLSKRMLKRRRRGSSSQKPPSRAAALRVAKAKRRRIGPSSSTSSENGSTSRCSRRTHGPLRETPWGRRESTLHKKRQRNKIRCFWDTSYPATAWSPTSSRGSRVSERTATEYMATMATATSLRLKGRGTGSISTLSSRRRTSSTSSKPLLASRRTTRPRL